VLDGPSERKGTPASLLAGVSKKRASTKGPKGSRRAQAWECPLSSWGVLPAGLCADYGWVHGLPPKNHSLHGRVREVWEGEEGSEATSINLSGRKVEIGSYSSK